jgi:hypothetical protein
MSSVRTALLLVLVSTSKGGAHILYDTSRLSHALGRTSGQAAPDPTKLIVPMIERFMATDRAFAKARRSGAAQTAGAPEKSG